MLHYKQDWRIFGDPLFLVQPMFRGTVKVCQRHSVPQMKMHGQRCGGACEDDMRRAADRYGSDRIT